MVQPNNTLPERAAPGAKAQDAYSPLVRRGDKDVLSLALMDARNYTLAIFEAFSSLAPDNYVTAADSPAPSPLWTLGHIAWQQEWRTLRWDEAAQMSTALPLLDNADALFEKPPAQGTALPKLDVVKQYLFDTLEASLDVLSMHDATDAALRVNGEYALRAYYLALFHEDRAAEILHHTLQILGLHEIGVCRNKAINISACSIILVPACVCKLGTARGESGFAFDEEFEAHVVRVPEFEIDAGLVTWAQYADFIAEGGYDEPAHWSREGLAWLTQSARREPLYVEQARSQIIVHRFGRLMRVQLHEPARHLTLWEAEAYARWAGRRLPTEVEWHAAASNTAGQGFAWGGLLEWTASRFRTYPGYAGHVHEPAVGLIDSNENTQAAQSVRGASFATSPRLRDYRLRRALAPDAAHEFVGFRTCAL